MGSALLFSTAVHKRTQRALPRLTVCAPKGYFGHEHHLFRERLLLLLHSLASGVLLVDWTCLLALHYYWFCTPVFNRGPQAYPACPSTTYGLRSKRLLRPRASPVPGATTTASTFPRQWRPAGRLDLPPRPALLLVLHSCFQPRSTSVPSVLLHDSTGCAPKDYFGHEHHLFRERLLLPLHSLVSGVLLVDWTCLLALHYYWFCTPVFNRGLQAYPACPSTTLRSALQKVTSATSITCSGSDYYCFYIPSPMAPCW
ncbi:uncharacterized protein LOC142574497 [Dermacentor variabilis]|uniref:uncharacterized protein LOC142574497 n=1 Tax=Dermacentor variabilis TaxID=34621 RepID=UPI003F5C8BF7